MREFCKQRPASRAVGVLLATVLTLGWPFPSPAQDRTVVESMIAAQNPCASLKATQFGVSFGVDTLKEIKVDQIDLSLRGEHVSLSMAGRLGCRTSPSAVMQGDAVASIRADASVLLAGCVVRNVSVALGQFGGSLAGILASARPQIEYSLTEHFRTALTDSCHRFNAGR